MFVGVGLMAENTNGITWGPLVGTSVINSQDDFQGGLKFAFVFAVHQVVNKLAEKVGF